MTVNLQPLDKKDLTLSMRKLIIHRENVLYMSTITSQTGEVPTVHFLPFKNELYNVTQYIKYAKYYAKYLYI